MIQIAFCWPSELLHWWDWFMFSTRTTYDLKGRRLMKDGHGISGRYYRYCGVEIVTSDAQKEAGEE